MAVETGFAVLDGVADFDAFEQRATLVAHVSEHLRQRIEPVADLRYRLLLLFYDGKYCSAANRPSPVVV